ncbi:MAG: penicillin-binding transpeptidase domain-containing protein [Chitinophagaceae bacterium]
MKKLIYIFSVILLIQACSSEHVVYQNQWKKIFDEYQIDSACFELTDNTHDKVYLYNLPMCSRQVCPASTFKIFSSLVALESNVAKDENLVIPWDGTMRRAAWDKDMNMREALKVSNLPFYQELVRRIGHTEMKKWIDSVRYGNKNIAGKEDEFWLNDSLKISPDEQVGFIKKLYFDKLPFSQRAQRIVRSMMLQEDTENYKLYYKTGTRQDEQRVRAWLVGFVERKEEQKGVKTNKMETHYRPYFFALYIDSKERGFDLMESRKTILKTILKEQNIIK